MQLIFTELKLNKTCSICRSVLSHKFIGDPRWYAWCAKLHYIAACCRFICFFTCCVSFMMRFVYVCLLLFMCLLFCLCCVI